MTLNPLLSRWRADSTIGPNVVEWRTIPERQPRFTPFPEDLHPALAAALLAQGIQRLYIHQSASWRCARDGQHVVVVTGTASGKTLCFNLPVLDSLLRDPDARALYLYPTKALAQDQLAVVHKLLADIGDQSRDHPARYPLAPAVYDGDTPASARSTIRREARLVISNPDMLHTGILPHHTSWAEFFRNLRFIVIDEMHIYRGVFGSHVANVLRRLKRVARFYGSAPQFILTSATIANPAELAGWLIEAPVSLVDEDGSARGAKHFLIYNPPIVDRDLGVRRSSLQESVRLVEDLLTYDIQTILFGISRRSVEIMLRYLQEKAGGMERGRGSLVRGYRSGYLPLQRREIERGLRSGEVRAVVATSALELGIDIGGMGAALLAGYPGTIAATWQQAGRAGRTNEVSLSILVASANPLDQFLARHPEYFFDHTPERGLINPNNLLILLHHLRCAAFELPFRDGEGFGNVPAEQLTEFLEFLREEGVLHRSGDRFFWMADRYPAEGVSLRSTSGETVLLQIPQEDAGEETSWKTIGEVDIDSAN